MHALQNAYFPKVKMSEKDYRKSLITVPSCDDHNLRKTKDDEYLMFVLACNIVNNEVAMERRELRKFPELGEEIQSLSNCSHDIPAQ